MKRRILKFVTTNPGYKLLAFVLAFALWLVVYNSDDPNKTITYTVAVTVENESTLTDMGKCYEITNNSGTVTFAVTAKRSVLDKLESSDFSAIADLSQLTFSEDGSSGSVEVDISADRFASSVKISGRTKYLEVQVENVVTRQFVVKAATTGTLKTGFAMGNVSVGSPNVLKVEGPESIVERIADVIATVDVGIMEQARSYSITATPVLYDEEGNTLSTRRLELSDTQVTVVATVLDTREVELQYSTSGTPAGENMVSDIRASKDTVTVKGTTATLNQISSIVIPAEAVSVEGAEDDVTVEIDLRNYLPDGVDLLDEEDNTITITVEIADFGKKLYTIPVSSLEVSGLEDGLTFSYNVSALSVTIMGTDEDLAKLDSSQIKGHIDLGGMEIGDHTVEVQLDLNQEVYTWTTTPVSITISRAEDE